MFRRLLPAACYPDLQIGAIFLVVLGSADKVVGGGEVGEAGDNSTLVQR